MSSPIVISFVRNEYSRSVNSVFNHKNTMERAHQFLWKQTYFPCLKTTVPNRFFFVFPFQVSSRVESVASEQEANVANL